MYSKFKFLNSGALYPKSEMCYKGIILHVCSYLRHITQFINWVVSEMYIKFQFWGSGALYLRFVTCSEGIIRHVGGINTLFNIVTLE